MDAIMTLWFMEIVIPVTLIGIGYILGVNWDKNNKKKKR